MWERPEFGVKDLQISLDQVANHPDSVRKWLYRLMLKDPITTGLDPSAVDHLWRREETISAREGLALGLLHVDSLDYDSVLVDWYHGETDDSIKDTILVCIAKRASADSDLAQLVQDVFLNAAPGGATRKRLLAAASQGPLSVRLKRIELDDEIKRQGMLEFYTPNTVILGGRVDMSSTTTTFSAGGDINGQILAGGDVVNSANAAVQNLDQSRSADQKVLSEVLSWLAKAQLPEAERDAVAKAVQSVTDDPKKDNKINLLNIIQNISKGVGAVSTLAPTLVPIITHLAAWIN